MLSHPPTNDNNFPHFKRKLLIKKGRKFGDWKRCNHFDFLILVALRYLLTYYSLILYSKIASLVYYSSFLSSFNLFLKWYSNTFASWFSNSFIIFTTFFVNSHFYFISFNIEYAIFNGSFFVSLFFSWLYLHDEIIWERRCLYGSTE